MRLIYEASRLFNAGFDVFLLWKGPRSERRVRRLLEPSRVAPE
jgi:hypothetical protein